jgi:hypothetical protein
LAWPIISLVAIGSLSPIDDNDPSTGFRDRLGRKRGAVDAPQGRRCGPTGMELDADEHRRFHGLA